MRGSFAVWPFRETSPTEIAAGDTIQTDSESFLFLEYTPNKASSGVYLMYGPDQRFTITMNAIVAILLPSSSIENFELQIDQWIANRKKPGMVRRNMVPDEGARIFGARNFHYLPEYPDPKFLNFTESWDIFTPAKHPEPEAKAKPRFIDDTVAVNTTPPPADVPKTEIAGDWELIVKGESVTLRVADVQNILQGKLTSQTGVSQSQQFGYNYPWMKFVGPISFLGQGNDNSMLIGKVSGPNRMEMNGLAQEQDRLIVWSARKN
jgi:hypothetical protein